jgi:hypothetical protein
MGYGIEYRGYSIGVIETLNLSQKIPQRRLDHLERYPSIQQRQIGTCLGERGVEREGGVSDRVRATMRVRVMVRVRVWPRVRMRIRVRVWVRDWVRAIRVTVMMILKRNNRVTVMMISIEQV